jgi:hypothetical protein
MGEVLEGEGLGWCMCEKTRKSALIDRLPSNLVKSAFGVVPFAGGVLMGRRIFGALDAPVFQERA